MATFSFLWDSTYESQPPPGLNRNQIDNQLRLMHRAIRERMEVAHNFGQYTTKDDGSHRGGFVKVLLKGDSAARDALANVQTGSLYLLETGGKLQLQIYDGASWNNIGVTDHGDLSGLAGLDHPQYIEVAGDTMTGPISGDGIGAEVYMPLSNQAVQASLLTYYHAVGGHSSLGNIDAIEDASALAAVFANYETASVNQLAENPTGAGYPTYSPRGEISMQGAIRFTPNTYLNPEADFDAMIVPASAANRIACYASAGSGLISYSYTFRVKYRYI